MPIGASRDLGEIVAKNDTLFDTRIADRTVNRLDLPSTYKLNTERYIYTRNGTEDRTFGTGITNQPAKYQLTASDGDTVTLASRERLRYVPNYESLWGIAAWYETAADQLSSDQHLYVELADDARDNAYGYELTPDNTRTYLRSGGQLIDERPRSDWRSDPIGNGLVDRDQPLNPRCYIGWYGALGARTTLAHTISADDPGADGDSRTAELGYLHNPDDIATKEINLRLRVTADADPGAAEFTVNVGSMGGLIRGGATEFDRNKAAAFYDLNDGSIGPEWENNTPLLAKRVAPDSKNVAVSVQPPEFSPSGSTTMELLVGAVPASATDATGFAYADSGDPQNTAVQYTTDVTTFPTETRPVPTGGTDTVPDIRQLAHVIAQGEKNSASKAEAGTATEFKRQLGKDEIALYIPRTAPGQTGATVNWLRPINKQDW